MFRLPELESIYTAMVEPRPRRDVMNVTGSMKHSSDACASLAAEDPRSRNAFTACGSRELNPGGSWRRYSSSARVTRRGFAYGPCQLS